MAGQRFRRSSRDRNGTRQAFAEGSHRAQGTSRNAVITARE